MPEIQKHDGKAMPCDPEAQTVVKYRDGSVSPCALPARCRSWVWPMDGVGNRPYDILAWREAKLGDKVWEFADGVCG